MKAIILLSGGLDSTVMLANAVAQGRQVLALTFDYCQRHRCELAAASAVAAHYGISHRVVVIDAKTFDKSALVSDIQVPKGRNLDQINSGAIPSTYVPARNTLFLAYATAHAEVLEAQEIYFGANAADQKAYPDTRPEYQAAFQGLLNVATKQAVEGHAPKLLFPQVKMDKKEIIKLGTSLKAPLHLTLSCYDPFEGKHCGRCDACYLRKTGFLAAGCEDSTSYLVNGLPLEAADL
jgi:7-cyano-7-deazaguanine synthase